MKKKYVIRKIKSHFLFSLIISSLIISGCSTNKDKREERSQSTSQSSTSISNDIIKKCGRTPFSVEFEGVNSKLSVKISSDLIPALRHISEKSEDQTSVSAELNLSLVRSTSNLLMTYAFKEVIDNYSCYLINSKPEVENSIKNARDQFILLIDKVFDDSLYAGTYSERNQNISPILNDAGSQSTIIQNATSISRSELPDPNFTEYVTTQLQGILKSEAFGEVYGCLGARFSSIANLDPRVFSGLQMLRDDFLSFMEGSTRSKIAASSLISTYRKIYDSSKPIPNLTVTDVTCLKSIEDEITTAASSDI